MSEEYKKKFQTATKTKSKIKGQKKNLILKHSLEYFEMNSHHFSLDHMTDHIINNLKRNFNICKSEILQLFRNELKKNEEIHIPNIPKIAPIKLAIQALHKTENVEANKPIESSNRKQYPIEQEKNDDNKMEIEEPEIESPKGERIKLKKEQFEIMQAWEETKVRDRPRFLHRRLPKLNKDSGEKIADNIEIIESEKKSNYEDRIYYELHPFSSSECSFITYYNEESLELDRMSRKFTRFHEEVEKFEFEREKQKEENDPQRFLQTLDFSKRKLNLIYRKIALENKKKIIAHNKKLENLELLYDQLNYYLKKNEKNQESIKENKRQIELAEKKILNLHEKKAKLKNKISNDRFEICIIKEQATKTLYRYGANILRPNITKQDYLLRKYYKFENKVKNINVLDLKIFIMTTLYPMAISIFNDFSSQCNVYKVMFGMGALSKEETEASMIMLNKRIEKHMYEKNHHSLEECAKLIMNRKKKIIFIGSIDKFNEIMREVIEQIQGFSNGSLQIIGIDHKQVSNSFDGTNFSHNRLTIFYTYNDVKVETVFDLLYCVPFLVRKQEIETLRKEAHKFEPVLCWFEIPKVELEEEKIQTYKEIHLALNRSKLFHFNPEKERLLTDRKCMPKEPQPKWR